MSFEQFSFDPRIQSAIQAVNYTIPTPIQERAIPVILEGRDILGIAQTGTGKTAAFVLPILQRLSNGPLRRARALILAPTRELAEQIHQATMLLGQKTQPRSAAIYGGVKKGPQLAAFRRGTEILVACPGRLLDHVRAGDVDLSAIEVVVLDEADRMCDMGFLPDIRRILSHLPAKRQTLFFSATMPREIRALADSILDHPETVQIGQIAPAESVSHALYPVPLPLKTELLLSLLDHDETGRALVFTRTKHKAHNLAASLKRAGHRVAALQGNMTQAQRQQAISGFRNRRYDVLVATDVASRGIDVTDIETVINYDMPESVDAYTHRIGRTGRADRSGQAFTLAVRGDGVMIRQIERALGESIDRRRLPGFEYGAFSPEAQFQAPRSTSSSLPRSFRGRRGSVRRSTVRS